MTPCLGNDTELELMLNFSPDGGWTWVWDDVVLLGGGSAAAGGRTRISEALRSDPAYSTVARYELHRESESLQNY